MNHQENIARYPMLEGILALRNLPLQPMYTTRAAAQVFGITGRGLQNWMRSGRLVPRDLPGRARFLSKDLEEFLMASRKQAS